VKLTGKSRAHPGDPLDLPFPERLGSTDALVTIAN
jgi:hypothetical protein